VARHGADGGWLLEGVKSFVSNLHIADTLTVLARVEADDGLTGFGFFVVRPKVDPGLRLEPLSTFAADRQSEVTFDQTPCRAESFLGGVSRPDETIARFEHVVDMATALQCMEMVGGAEHVIDITADYVRERRQFNRPIGSFQAVQHHLANAASDIEGANLASLEAVWRLSEGLPARREVSFAKAWTGRAYKDATLIAHQLFGGIGYARDSDLHFWSGRAKATEIGFGTPDDHLERVSALMDL
jgi:alkylation response protein AidB-like acyl-CoA dehydrogenase